MKSIGILGGMSWESTASYYRAINQGVQQALGGLHSAKVIMNSVDFHELEAMLRKGQWDSLATLLTKAAKSVEAGGADFVLIATNTMHKLADSVQAGISIPLVHIADATAERLLEKGIKKVGLLGTKFTMEQDFYCERMADRYGIEVLVPDSESRELVHEIIFQELIQGKFMPESKRGYLRVIHDLHEQGAEGVILGCTEIPLLVDASDTDIPLFDTTAIHCDKAVSLAVNGDSV